MRLLLDSSIWPRTADALRRMGYDIVWVGDWSQDPGDRAILGEAHRDGRIRVTHDKDFGELAVRHAVPHSGIVRLVEMPVVQQASLCELVLERHADELHAGAVITADPERIRVRASNR